jgi:hypothetical protein
MSAAAAVISAMGGTRYVHDESTPPTEHREREEAHA